MTNDSQTDTEINKREREFWWCNIRYNKTFWDWRQLAWKIQLIRPPFLL